MTIPLGMSSTESSTREGRAELAPFEEVYERHAGSVHRFCVSQVADRAAAEDLTHETFVKAFQVYERVGPDLASARPWLLAIARNLCVDHHRRRGRWRRAFARLTSRPVPAADVEALAGERADIERVISALAELREKDRQLIGLRVAAELSYPEIGELLGRREAAVRLATHRALLRLRARLENDR
jgi:RNA polymerase sigma-70 factor, ECF subfamily